MWTCTAAAGKAAIDIDIPARPSDNWEEWSKGTDRTCASFRLNLKSASPESRIIDEERRALHIR